MTGCLLRINRTCNQDCLFCHIEKRKTYLNLKSFKLKIDFLKNLKIDSVYLSGGEPSIHPHIKEIIGYIKEKEMNFSISTNGSSNAEFIIDNNPSHFFLSFYSIDKKTDEIISHSDNYESRIKTVLYAKDKNFNKMANIIINRINQDNIYDTVNFLRKNNFKIKVTFPIFHEEYIKNFKKLYLDSKNLRKILDTIKPEYQEDIPACIYDAESLGLNEINTIYIFDEGDVPKIMWLDENRTKKKAVFCGDCNKCSGFRYINLKYVNALYKRNLF